MTDDSLHQLSRRERECLALVGAGYRSGEIGALLRLSSGTVDNYIKAAARKTGVSDRKLLARRLRDYDPEGIQRIVQRLDSGRKTVASPMVDNPDQFGGTVAVAEPGGAKITLPAPPGPVPREGRRASEKLLLSLLVAVSTAAILAVLVYFSNHTLSDLPVIN